MLKAFKSKCIQKVKCNYAFVSFLYSFSSKKVSLKLFDQDNRYLISSSAGLLRFSANSDELKIDLVKNPNAVLCKCWIPNFVFKSEFCIKPHFLTEVVWMVEMLIKVLLWYCSSVICWIIPVQECLLVLHIL